MTDPSRVGDLHRFRFNEAGREPLPRHDLLVRMYLDMPFVWRWPGRQFLVRGVRPR